MSVGYVSIRRRRGRNMEEIIVLLFLKAFYAFKIVTVLCGGFYLFGKFEKTFQKDFLNRPTLFLYLWYGMFAFVCLNKLILTEGLKDFDQAEKINFFAEAFFLFPML